MTTSRSGSARTDVLHNCVYFCKHTDRMCKQSIELVKLCALVARLFVSVNFRSANKERLQLWRNSACFASGSADHVSFTGWSADMSSVWYLQQHMPMALM